MLSKLTQYQYDQIEDNATTTVGDAKTKKSYSKYLGGKVKALKFDYALKGWRNIFDKDGNQVSYTSDKKKLLPNAIRLKIIEKIDEDNELNEDEEEGEDNAKK